MIRLKGNGTATVEAIERQPAGYPAHEKFHSLLRSLPWPCVDSKLPRLVTLGFTSCLPEEGVTTFAVRTASAAAAVNSHQVVVIDANFYRPSIHQMLEVNRGPGMAEVIEGRADLQEVIQKTALENVSAFTTGEHHGDPAALFAATARWRDLVDALKNTYDLAIFDISQIGTSEVTMPLLSLLDGVVLVVEFERVDAELARRVTWRLSRANVPLLGTALNKQYEHIPRWLSRFL